MKQNRDLASRLRHRVTFEVPIITSDSGGGQIYSWDKFADSWAEVIPQKPTKVLLGEQLMELATYNVVMRYNKKIKSYMRMKFSGRYFDIKGVWHENESGKITKIIMIEDIFI